MLRFKLESASEKKMSKLGFKIPKDWQVKLFSETATLCFSNVDKKSYDGQKKVKLCNYMDVFYNDYIRKNLNFREATASDAEIKKFLLKKNDVIFTKDSETADEIAKCSVVAEDLDGIICGYHLGIARPREGIDGFYLSKVMNFHPVHQKIIKLANGVTRFGLTLSSFDNLFLPVPPLQEQKKISIILCTWDEAIKKTEHLIVTKERRKQSLLVRAIFSNRLDTPLSKFLKPTLRPVSKPNTAYRALGIRSHGKGTFQRSVGDPRKVGMDTLYEVKADDLIVNITFAWEGAVALVKPEDEGCLVSHRFPTYEIITAKAYPPFIRHTIRSKRFKSLMELISPGGAGRNRVLNKKAFLKQNVWLPDLKTQKFLGDLLDHADYEIAMLEQYLEKLKTQKRGLMQKLLTGQWRVKGAA